MALERTNKHSSASGPGITTTKGWDSPEMGDEVYTQPSSPDTSDGGPVSTFDGGEEGSNHSKTTPGWNTVDSPKNESGSDIEGPWDVGYGKGMR